MNTIRVSNSLDPDQTPHFVGPDLGPNCLQRLSAGRSRINLFLFPANAEQIDAAKEVIKKLQISYSADSFENPVPQKHWRNIVIRACI